MAGVLSARDHRPTHSFKGAAVLQLVHMECRRPPGAAPAYRFRAAGPIFPASRQATDHMATNAAAFNRSTRGVCGCAGAPLQSQTAIAEAAREEIHTHLRKLALD